MSIKVTLPDGSVKEVEKGTTSLDIAKGISEGLARNVLAAEVNNEVVDAMRPIETDSTLKLLTWQDKEDKSTMWHSSAHLMAEARSEEHTSELQSRPHLVCRLLLEKKKKNKN